MDDVKPVYTCRCIIRILQARRIINIVIRGVFVLVLFIWQNQRKVTLLPDALSFITSTLAFNDVIHVLEGCLWEELSPACGKYEKEYGGAVVFESGAAMMSGSSFRG